MHIPGTVKGAEHARLVGGIHLLHPDGEYDIGRTRFDIIDRQVESRAGRRTGVLDIHHGDTLQSARTQRNLAAHHVLSFHVPLHAIAEKGGFYLARRATGILQHGGEGLCGQGFQRFVQMFAKRRHADAGHEYFVHEYAPL